MNDNPYSSPNIHDDWLLRRTIKRLIEFKNLSPAAVGLRLLRTLPLYALLGAVVIPWLLSLNAPGPTVTIIAGMLIGAGVRDASVARKSVLMWKIQKELLDWPRIEAVARELEI